MTKVIVRPLAKLDMADIIDRRARDAGDLAASELAMQFDEKISFIGQYPRASEARPKWGRTARRALVPPYLMIYDLDLAADTATVLRVLHGRRRITQKMLLR